MQAIMVKRRGVKVVASTPLTIATCKEAAMSVAHSNCVVEYRPIANYPAYRVGSDGTVWTSRIQGKYSRVGGQWRQLRFANAGHGYQVVSLTNDSGRRMFYVHSLVLEAFVCPRPAGMQACHYPDQSPLNNSVGNLRWDTPLGNIRDKAENGTQPIGEKNPRAKLTSSDVVEIRRRVAAGDTKKRIAREYGVTDTLVRMIELRKCWKHV